jgi:phosphomannomutase
VSDLLISVSGVRGIVGVTLTAEVALNYAAAFGTFIKKGKIAIGGDTRRTGPMINSAAIAGLLSTGHDVVDNGICPTPTIEIAVRDGEFAGGIAITASHNPDEYNALKLIGPGGLFLNERQAARVNDIYHRKKSIAVGWKDVGKLSSENGWIDHHIEKMVNLDIISINEIRERGLTVVADCVGGAAAMAADKFFYSLGVRYNLINSQIGEKFPHPPEPIPENLNQLCQAVLESKADIGFAFDPDADRLAIVSEKGEPLGEEYTLALGARYILRHKQGPMVVNLSSSLLNDNVAREADVRLYRTKVGERNVTEKMMRIKAIVGGEGNGGLIYPELHWGRDGLLAAAVITQYLASTKKTISALAEELPHYTMLKTKMIASRKEVNKKAGAIEKIFPNAKIDRLDGVKISGDDWWVQVRASNTEPIARLMAEANDPRMAKSLINAVKSVLLKK